MPTVIANEIVGVQPMTGPVGQIHTLRVRYSDSFDNVTAGEEALSPFKIAEGYSGNVFWEQGLCKTSWGAMPTFLHYRWGFTRGGE